MAMCLCIHLSIRLSVTSRSSVKTPHDNRYLGVVFQCKTGATDNNTAIISRNFIANNILSVTGRSPQELCTLNLVKTYCLPVGLLLYGCENWLTNSSIINKVSVAWNNCFRRFFHVAGSSLLYRCSISLEHCACLQ